MWCIQIRASKKEARFRCLMISLKNLNKSYKVGKDDVPILRDIQLHVKEGEFHRKRDDSSRRDNSCNGS